MTNLIMMILTLLSFDNIKIYVICLYPYGKLFFLPKGDDFEPQTVKF